MATDWEPSRPRGNRIEAPPPDESGEGPEPEWQDAALPPPPERTRRRVQAWWHPIATVPVLIGVIIVLLSTLIGLGAAYLAGAFSTPPRSPVAAAQRPQLQVTKTATYGDWNYTCVKAPNAPDARCAISQQVSDAKTRTPLFMWRVVQDGKGGLIGEWQTRSGVLVNRGIVIDAGTDKPMTIPFQACMPDGCNAVLTLAPDVVDRIGKATKASVTLYPVGDTDGVQLTISVKGLPDALAALKH